eukprot:CAMPEP_0195077728 /NCGR_PEP_ID=MMETSP0448-20130528/20089_1 /TAXON_ID=66468 /ORGANISM="Heterocapsa triquestra, Strain CCMP 448" /LENGTH=56 /DNA_ID=CAMNT_0040110397 /DNA_START=67 /DNA_END=235 /DNA_ORIENTATION=+
MSGVIGRVAAEEAFGLVAPAGFFRSYDSYVHAGDDACMGAWLSGTSSGVVTMRSAL